MEKSKVVSEYFHRKKQAAKKLKNQRDADLICRCFIPMRIHDDDLNCDWCGRIIEN